MNELTLVNKNGVFYADSRQVAGMTEKRHADLMRDIENYAQILENAKLRFQDFFIPDTYKVKGNNKTYPCYLLTKKGCDMVANKMTGQKGVLFTAEYVTRFYEMEKQLQDTFTSIIPQTYSEALQIAANLQKQIEADKPKVEQFDKFISARGVQNMNHVAKSLGTGRNRLMKFLRTCGVFMEDNMPYQRYIDAGLFAAKQRKIMGKVCVQPFVTAKGISFIFCKLGGAASVRYLA